MNDFADRVGTQVRPRGRPGEVGGVAPSSASPAQPQPGPQTSFDGERRWQSNGDLFWNANLTLEALPPGLYRPRDAPNIGACLERTVVDTDDLMEFPDSPSLEVLTEIRQFWKLEAEFAARGFIHKRGVLLWGPPGSGKTATLAQLIAIVIREHRGIGLFLDHPGLAAHCLQMARRIEPKRPLVVLMEDLDALVERHGENEFLALLDGEAQVANVIFVATTNYPERLDRRFVDRPSRFDLIKQIGMPSAAARKAYLGAKEPSLSEAELEQWVKSSDGFSIAHLRELIVLCRCYEKPFDAAVRRLQEMREGKPNSGQADDGRRGGDVGFRTR